MSRPVVGVIGNAHFVEKRFNLQAVGVRNLKAIAEVAGALPLMFATEPGVTDIGTLLEVVDGVVLTGARANVHPTRFRTEPHPSHEPYDEARDALALGLIEECVARGVPILGICRGFQEMNVAFGGTLHPEIREIPGRMNHRMPRLENGEIHPDPAVIFADRHDVTLVPGGAFAKLFGCETIRVNSLHGQGILEPGTPDRGRGRGGGRHDRGDPHRRCAGLCARRAMARRARPARQRRQPRPLPGLRPGPLGAPARGVAPWRVPVLAQASTVDFQRCDSLAGIRRGATLDAQCSPGAPMDARDPRKADIHVRLSTRKAGSARRETNAGAPKDRRSCPHPFGGDH